jgi:multisubunit Na+/H+ antiporter MnhB subunit
MRKRMTRERIAAAVLTLAGVALAIALTYNPRLPGPTQLVDTAFRPAVFIIGKMSEKRGDQTP